MGKTLGEIGKIIITAIISILTTYIVLSQTITQKKADVTYVDKQDTDIKREFREKDAEMKQDFLRLLEKLNENLDEQNKDIKKLLERRY